MQIDLLLPGLFDRLPDWSKNYSPMAAFPVLEKLMAAGTVSPTPDRSFESAVWRCYDPGWNPNEELPSARVLHGASGTSTFHAEPVHLKAGMSDLIMFRPDPLLTRDEKNRLVSLFNAHFATDGLQLSLDDAGNGFLTFSRPMSVRTTEPSRAVGQGIFPRLPRGGAAAELGRLGNEIQMLLHGADFNATREQNGQLNANGLWLWGSGESQRALQPAHDFLLANNPYPLACAAKAGQASKSLPKTLDPQNLPASARRILIVLDALLPAAENDDIYRWQQTLTQLEQTWFTPLQTALRAGTIRKLRMNPCNGKSWSLSPRSHWKLWRRSKPLANQA